jgi:hypothetical protein
MTPFAAKPTMSVDMAQPFGSPKTPSVRRVQFSVLRMDADVRAYAPDSAHQLNAQCISFRSSRKVI